MNLAQPEPWATCPSSSEQSVNRLNHIPELPSIKQVITICTKLLKKIVEFFLFLHLTVLLSDTYHAPVAMRSSAAPCKAADCSKCQPEVNKMFTRKQKNFMCILWGFSFQLHLLYVYMLQMFTFQLQFIPLCIFIPLFIYHLYIEPIQLSAISEV